MTVRKRTFIRKQGTLTKWLVDLIFHHPDGTRERFRKVSPVQTKRGAEQYEREVRESLLAKSSISLRQAEKKRLQRIKLQEAGQSKVPTLDGFAPEFIKVYAHANNKPSEVYSKTMALQNHLLPAFSTRKLDKIMTRDIEAFKAAMIDKGLAPKTINNVLAVLGKMLKTAKVWNLLQAVPEIKLLRLPILEHSFLSFAEGNQLIAAVDTKMFRAMVTLALRTGLRLGELRALRWQDVDLRNARLVVRRAAWQNLVGVPKSGRARGVGLSGQVVCALQALEQRGGDLTVFCDDKEQMLTKGACKWPLYRGCDASGLGRRIGWHVLRHTFASHLAMRGVALKVIQELLGHSDMKMTMRYAHLTPQVRHAAIELLDGD